jgi:hypothetical protein
MRQGKFIKDHAAEMARTGPDLYAASYPWHVLIGLGVLEGTTEMKRVPDRATFVVDVGQAVTGLAGSLADRVWFIRRDSSGPRLRGISLGRSMDNDVVIPDYSISMRHCELLEEPEGLKIVDREALNATRVGRKPLPPNVPTLLLDQQTITLGRFEFQFLVSGTFVRNIARMGR